MNWFVLALICFLSWGSADLFYKKGSDENDSRSHLKTAVWVGLVMGICSFVLMSVLKLFPGCFLSEFSSSSLSFSSLISGGVKYLPASLGYIISMVIGYAGLRYLELSIISPVQNASGALSAIVMSLWFVLTSENALSAIEDETGFTFGYVSGLPLLNNIFISAGIGAVIAGVIILAVAENRLSKNEINRENKKYRLGALALLFPLLYCFFDTVGTAADGIILDEESGLGLGEIDVLILYGLTFFIAGAVIWVYLLIKEKKPYNPFRTSEKNKGIAALCEEFGQVFYVFAMASKPVLAAPIIASYCIVSVILSRIFIKEKLRPMQLTAVITVIVGIVLLGISEGIGEM